MKFLNERVCCCFRIWTNYSKFAARLRLNVIFQKPMLLTKTGIQLNNVIFFVIFFSFIFSLLLNPRNSLHSLPLALLSSEEYLMTCVLMLCFPMSIVFNPIWLVCMISNQSIKRFPVMNSYITCIAQYLKNIITRLQMHKRHLLFNNFDKGILRIYKE